MKEIKHGVLSKDGTPGPTKGKAMGCKGNGGRGKVDGENEGAANGGWDVDGPECVFKVKLGVKHGVEVRVGEEGGGGWKAERRGAWP